MNESDRELGNIDYSFSPNAPPRLVEAEAAAEDKSASEKSAEKGESAKLRQEVQGIHDCVERLLIGTCEAVGLEHDKAVGFDDLDVDVDVDVDVAPRIETLRRSDLDVSPRIETLQRPDKRLFVFTLILASILPLVFLGSIAVIFAHMQPENLILSWTLPNNQALFIFSALSGAALAFSLLLRRALNWREKASVFGVTPKDILAVALIWVLVTPALCLVLVNFIPWDWRWPWMINPGNP